MLSSADCANQIELIAYVQIHRDGMVDSSHGQEIGDQPGCDCASVGLLLRLAGIWEVSCIFLSGVLIS